MIYSLALKNTSSTRPAYINFMVDGGCGIVIPAGGTFTVFERGYTDANTANKFNVFTFKRNINALRTLQVVAKSPMRRPATPEEYYDPDFVAQESYFSDLSFIYNYAGDVASVGDDPTPGSNIETTNYDLFVSKVSEANMYNGGGFF